VETLRDLETSEGMIEINCGDEVRILVPMQTHPIFSISPANNQDEVAEAETGSINGYSMPKHTSMALRTLIFYIFWLLITVIFLYPYMMIIFIVCKRMGSTDQDDDTSHAAASILLIASAISAAWSSSCSRCLKVN
jgi:hypothetical protein